MEEQCVLVDKNRPYDSLCSIEKLAVDKYDGNLSAVIDELLFDKEGDGINPYVKDMNSDVATLVYMRLRQYVIDEHYGGSLEAYRLALQFERRLYALDMTKEQFLSAEKKSFVSVLWKKIGILLFGIVLLSLLSLLFRSYLELYGLICSIVIAVLSFKVIGAWRNLSHFKKAKKLHTELEKLMETQLKSDK